MIPKSRSIPVEYIKECFEYREEYVNGVLQGNVYWKYREDKSVQWNGRFAGKKAGAIDSFGYCVTSVVYNSFRCHLKIHTIVWILNHGCYPDDMIDHKNNNRSNNLIVNIRPADAYLNILNTEPLPNRSSQYKGVYFRKAERKWVTRYTLSAETYYVGGFIDELEAALAYNESITTVHNIEYAYFNDISNGYTNKEYPNMPRHYEPEKVAA
jgi:hypothetical protein